MLNYPLTDRKIFSFQQIYFQNVSTSDLLGLIFGSGKITEEQIDSETSDTRTDQSRYQ